ncbi:MAG: helix-turn-helix domain-containing protein [Oceanibaculum nanhaiense]|uniref:helix-turn-helix domain-containing protein n=1 Tax=Oceanibaculum nanhaiense TaxID=1909734 RepID=UPI0032EEAD54
MSADEYDIYELAAFEPLAYSIAAAARLLGVSVSSVRALIRDGTLPAVKRGRRTLILAWDLKKLLT